MGSPDDRAEMSRVTNLLDDSFIETVVSKYGYQPVEDNFTLGALRDPAYMRAAFSCHDRAKEIEAVPKEKVSLVTGFGPTSTPTAGTLSVVMKAIKLQRDVGIETDIIISDLGAWNSRRLDWPTIGRNTRRFIDFISACGFDESRGRVRSHRSEDSLITSGLIAKVLTERDFKENHEATDHLYDLMNLRGSYFGIMIDGLYTVADILCPLIVHGQKHVLVLAGIEEHYFVELAKLVLGRLKMRFPGVFVDENAGVSALYAKLIGGLHPYPKMSKSIPDSSINLDDSPASLENKIVRCSSVDDVVVLQMMELVSDWQTEKLTKARHAFSTRHEHPKAWISCKHEYAEYFQSICRLWKSVGYRQSGEPTKQ